MSSKLNIVCVLKKEGSRIYDESWVYKLKKSIERNVTIEHNFYCLSDTELQCKYYTLHKDTGWWNKIQLFRKDLFFGETLFFDLDTIILKNIDEFIEQLRNTDGNLLMWMTPKKTPCSTIMYWRNDLSNIWLNYDKNRPSIHKKYKDLPLIGDQGYIFEYQKPSFFNELMPQDYFAVASYNSLNVKENSAILIFYGKNSKPNKAKFSTNVIIKNYWN